MQVFMNTIIYISREKVMPYLSLQSEDIMTAEDIASIEKCSNPFGIRLHIFKNKIFDINSYFEHDGRIYFVYRNGLTSTFTTYDTETNETKLYDTIADDLLLKKIICTYGFLSSAAPVTRVYIIMSIQMQ